MTPSWGGVDLLESREALLGDLDRLDQWDKASCMRSNKEKCQVLLLGHNPRLVTERLESCPVEKDLDVLVTVDEHDPACAQMAKKAAGLLVCISNNVASRTRAVIFTEFTIFHRITGLEETFKIIESNPCPNTSTKPWH
ncbi:hypothetical protein TURU_093336 [Turdus rufiventris]|nr:hypothetical protein TURU_093336 [Turdus rufiventris]